jgi:hypothetical protein
MVCLACESKQPIKRLPASSRCRPGHDVKLPNPANRGDLLVKQQLAYIAGRPGHDVKLRHNTVRLGGPHPSGESFPRRVIRGPKPMGTKAQSINIVNQAGMLDEAQQWA